MSWQEIIKKEKTGWLLLVAVWFIFFLPLLSGQFMYFLDDLKIIYFPLEQEYAAFQHQWQLPLWSNLFGFGQPLLSWGQLGFFTPLHLLLRALWVPPLVLLQVSVVAYYLIGLIGSYIFARQQKLNIWASTLLSALIVFSGFSIGHLNHVNFYTTTMLLPWLLVAGSALVSRPTFYKTAALASLAAIMAVSGQPQVIAYAFAIAAIILIAMLVSKIYAEYKATKKIQWAFLGKIILATACAGIISLAIASINILPLQEFLPQTERNQTLPLEEYYEFSYPPHHAVTLLLPYFYGNHDSYWGAKGFQELAAFVGFAPLFLSIFAIASWQTKRPLRITGIILVLIALCMATGKYSPLYTTLVEYHLLPPLSVPGRFVYFLDIGISLLAALGLQDIITTSFSRRKRLIATSAAIIFIALILVPFFLSLNTDERSYHQFISLSSSQLWQLTPVIIGILIIPLIALRLKWPTKYPQTTNILLVLTTIVPLFLYSWNYNPRVSRKIAMSTNLFAEKVSAYSADHLTPARLYSHERLLQTTAVNENIRRTDPISPGFWVIQPLTPTSDNWQCILLDTYRRDERQGQLHIEIRQDINQSPIRTLAVDTSALASSQPSRLCFNPIEKSRNQTYYISIMSEEPTGIELTFTNITDSPDQAYFIRTATPTAEDIAASRKTARLNLEPQYVVTIDREDAMLARHIQVVARASSARWIGALSIRPYREFIEKFFANDGEVIDGDGIHAIERNRAILNLSGVTHLIQTLPAGSTDTMTLAGFEPIDSYHTGERQVTLYRNPDAYPKAFIVPQAQFIAAPDETRFAMSQPDFDPRQIVFVSGDTPPTNVEPTTKPLEATATITNYKPTQVDVHVSASHDAFLVVTDATTDQWQTYIDGKPAPHLIAYSVFKTAQIPAGDHTVSFRYYSPAVAKAKKVSLGGLLAIIILVVLEPLSKRIRKKA